MNNEKESVLQNSGLIDAPPLEEDYIAGATSQLGFNRVKEDADWRDLRQPGERQKASRIETMSCVSFSENNVAEIHFERQRRAGEIPASTMRELEALGYVVDGRLNLSDRFLAWASGTTKQGNYMNKVAQTLREVGAVPEADWPFINAPWDEFYKEPPQWVKDKAKKFLEFFQVSYEWVSVSVNPQSKAYIRIHLKQAPLQVALATCSPWDSEVGFCGRAGTNHAVTLLHLDENGVATIFDSYDPYTKVLSADYPIPSVLKTVITLKQPEQMNARFIYVKNKPEQYVELNGKKKSVRELPSKEDLADFFDIPLEPVEISQEYLDKLVDKGRFPSKRFHDLVDPEAADIFGVNVG
jgi:hypothetical protein